MRVLPLFSSKKIFLSLPCGKAETDWVLEFISQCFQFREYKHILLPKPPTPNKVKVDLPLCLTKHHDMKTYWKVKV
jgi:hypothetical protein